VSQIIYTLLYLGLFQIIHLKLAVAWIYNITNGNIAFLESQVHCI